MYSEDNIRIKVLEIETIIYKCFPTEKGIISTDMIWSDPYGCMLDLINKYTCFIREKYISDYIEFADRCNEHRHMPVREIVELDNEKFEKMLRLFKFLSERISN